MMRWSDKQKYIITSLVLAGIFLLLGSCSQGVGYTKNEIITKLNWPAAPAQAKIQYVGEFSTPEELGISKGFWSKFVEFFTGESEMALVRPMVLIKDQNDVVYVADPGIKGVHRFDTRNNKYKLIRRENNKPLPSPVALALDNESNLIITDSQLAGVFIVNEEETIASQLPVDIELEQPTGLAVGESGKTIYVVDTLKHKVFQFTLNGDLVRQFGGRGNADGQFNYPTMIHFKHDQLIVTDTLNFRIQRFDKKGQFVSKFGQLGDVTGYHTRPKGVSMDVDHNIYVVDALFHTVQIFDETGNFLMNFGEQGRSAGQFWLPTGIFIDQQQTIYIADSHNRRVQMFRYLGAVQ